MDDLFRLYSVLNCCKYKEEKTVQQLREINRKWKIIEEEYEEENQGIEENDNQTPNEVIDDDFYSEVEKVLAKAQESIKLDYQTINTKPPKNSKSKQ